jgi:hypothetical protein
MHYRHAIWMLPVALLLCLVPKSNSANGPTRVRIGDGGQFVVDGKDVFPIGFTTGPPPGSKAPNGNNGFAELAKNGFVFFQWLSRQKPWGPELQAEVDALMQEGDRNGVKIALSLGNALTGIHPGDTQKTEQLASIVQRYRDNPAMFLWKGYDEPQWGKIPPGNLKVFYDTVHRVDPNHPVWITQAPRGTAADLVPYVPDYDVGAIDIYAVSYPPGLHSAKPNKSLSVVGDYTMQMREAHDDQHKGLMMTLQICFSGVIKPGKTLRFPTFPEERYMSYQALIDGARALLYFGGGLEQCMSDEDRAYGWNWRFYHRVLEPLLEEFRPQSPLYPALIAPNSSMPVHVTGGPGLEFIVREAGSYIYLLAAKREDATAQFTFSGLPQDLTDGEVLFEAPRHVKAEAGRLTDWFGPNEVHVYRFHRP